MFVDTDLLRMGADFSGSAGKIVWRGASTFASIHAPAGTFGDFAEAEAFHQALTHARDSHARRMQGHHATLEDLAAKSNSAATVFAHQDHGCASSLDTAGRRFDT